MEQRTVTTLILDKIDTLLAGTNMIFDNSANNSVIIDIEEVFVQKIEGNTHYFDELSLMFPFSKTDRHMHVMVE